MAWRAEVVIERHDEPQVLTSVAAITYADSAGEAKNAAQFIYDAIAAGKLRFLRCAPSGDSYTDYETKVTTHKGYVRFSFRDEPGDEIIPDNAIIRHVAGLGDLGLPIFSAGPME